MEIFLLYFNLFVSYCIQRIYKEKYSPAREGVVYIGLFCLIGSNPNIVFYLFLFTFLYNLALKDIHTYYIEKEWMIISLLLIFFFTPYSIENVISSLVFGLPALCMYFKKWIGSADVYYLFLFGFLLGMERMIICVFFSVVTGFLFFLLKKDKIIPFVSCLCIGFFITALKGYSIFYFILNRLSSGI